MLLAILSECPSDSMLMSLYLTTYPASMTACLWKGVHNVSHYILKTNHLPLRREGSPGMFSCSEGSYPSMETHFKEIGTSGTI